MMLVSAVSDVANKMVLKLVMPRTNIVISVLWLSTHSSRTMVRVVSWLASDDIGSPKLLLHELSEQLTPGVEYEYKLTAPISLAIFTTRVGSPDAGGALGVGGGGGGAGGGGLGGNSGWGGITGGGADGGAEASR